MSGSVTDGTAAADASGDRTPTDQQLSVLLVRVGDSVHAVEAGYVARVVEEFALTRIPRTSDLVAGMSELDGEATVVVDVGRALGASRSGEPSATRRVVKLHREGGGAAGLLVDGVVGFETVDVDEIEPVERPGDGTPATDADDAPRDADETRDAATWVRATVAPNDSTRPNPVGVLDLPFLLQRVATSTRHDIHE